MHSRNGWLALTLCGLLSGCGGGNSGAVVGGDYPLAYVDRDAAAAGEPADGIVFVPGGDLYLRQVASPSATASNITRSYTQGRGDVSGPEASYDGRRLLFSMRGPDDATWNIWEYSLDNRTLRRVIIDDQLADDGDDIDPHYLPDGRIVFSSNRQAGSRAQLEQAGLEPFQYQEAYGREAALVLHVMNADGSGIEQISFNQSHDRNPTVRMRGDIMYARWEHMGNRNQQPIFTVRPDGRQLDVLYGAFSPGDSFLHPRELPDGRVISTVLPLAGSRNGGALVIADVLHHSDHGRRLDGQSNTETGQHQPTLYELPLGRAPSPYGRYTTPYPLWDGSRRVLVAWSPQQRDGASNPMLPDAAVPRYGIYMLHLGERSLRPIALADPGRILTDPVAMMPRPRPAVIEPAAARPDLAPRPFPPPECEQGITGRPFPPDDCEPDPDPDCKSPVAGRPYPGDCEPQPDPDPGCEPQVSGRPFPSPPDDCEPEPDPDPDPDCEDYFLGRPIIRPPDECEPGPGPGPDPDPDPDPVEPIRPAILNIRSVYDTDFLDSMGESVLTGSERIPRDADGLPDLARLQDASQSSPADRPARFLRVSKAVPLPPGLARDTIGATAFGRQQLLGYAPIEPDGSVRVAVPADTALAVAVIDAHGRAYQTHTSWLQARPGEERRCHGCHSTHRSDQPLNQGSINGGPFAGAPSALSAMPGETMAETRTRHDPTALQLQEHPVSQDSWNDPARSGRPLSPELRIDYAGLPTENRPSQGLIDYPTHIQPIWERHCVTCHGTGSALDLSAELSASGRMRSYDNLVLGQPLSEPETGDRSLIRRAPALVNVGGSANSSRSSHLMERLVEQKLLAPQPMLSGHNHSGLLNASELRLVAEWIDLGASYRNRPVQSADHEPARFEVEQFAQTVHPLLLNRCSSCHMPRAISGEPGAPRHHNPDHVINRFVLTGHLAADLAAAASMVVDACQPDSNPLLRRPRSGETGRQPHPELEHADRAGGRGPLLEPTDPAYLILRDWVARACP